MAANDILYEDGTATVWANSGDYSNAQSGLSRTHQLDLRNLADGAARQGKKSDLGAKRSRQFVVYAAMELASAPSSSEVIEIYWAASPSSTDGNANPGGASGSDAAYTGTSGDSMADSVKQLIHVGNLIVTSDGDPAAQFQQIGVLTDIPRYGMPVVKNEGGVALHSDGVEMFVALMPLIDEVQ